MHRSQLRFLSILSKTMATSSKSSGQWSRQSSDWSSALANYAKVKDPTSIPKNEIKSFDDQTLTIYDGYEKAKFHYLILPRCQFPLQRADNPQAETSTASSSSTSPPNLSTTKDGKLAFGTSAKGNTVPNLHLNSLNDLLKSPYASQVLKAMESASDKLIAEIEQDMRETPIPGNSDKKIGSSWGVMRGFHAVPSMKHVHLHVISKDLVAERLKHKKHYLSFKPDHGFFLHLKDVQELVNKGIKSLPKSPKAYEELLRTPLVSFHNGRTYKNMPELKNHLQLAWQEQVKKLSQEFEKNSVGRNDSELGQKETPLGLQDKVQGRKGDGNGNGNGGKRKIGQTDLDKEGEIQVEKK